MINDVIAMFATIFSRIWDFAEQINEEVPFLTIAIGLFLVYSLFRFIIMPMLKPSVGGSDSNDDYKKNKDVD